MARTPEYPTEESRNVGYVEYREKRVVTLDVSVSVSAYDVNGATEFEILLNGRHLTRLNEFRARRLGILPPN